MESDDLIVIILAGNDEKPDILGGLGAPSKFFMPFGDGLVGDRMLRAVDDLRCCKSIYVVVSPSHLGEFPFTTDGQRHCETVPAGTGRGRETDRPAYGVVGQIQTVQVSQLWTDLAACEAGLCGPDARDILEKQNGKTALPCRTGRP